MLDPWIIEEIKRKEQRGRIEQPVIQIPHPQRPPDRDRPDRDSGPAKKEEDPRGIAIIDFGVGGY